MSEKRRYIIPGQGEDERSWEVETLEDGRYQVWTPAGEVLTVDAFSPSARELNILLGTRSIEVAFVEAEGEVRVQVQGEEHAVEVLNERQHRMRAAGVAGGGDTSPELKSPMAGKVVQVLVEEGQKVEMGEVALVVEAMKMENDLKAHRAGVVTSVAVSAGEAVEVGDLLIVIEDDE